MIIVLSGFFLYHQKKKLITSRLEVSELKRKELESELDLTRHELISFSIRLTQNNQFITKIDEIMVEMSSEIGQLNTTDKLEGKLVQLRNSIKESVRLDKDWVNFQKQFDGVYVDFSKRL